MSPLRPAPVVRLVIAALALALLGLGSATPAAGAGAGTSAEPAPRAAQSAAPSTEQLASKALAKLNKKRKARGCRALVSKPQLVTAAQVHTTLMATTGTLSHQLPGEASLPDRVSATGYSWSRVAENVAMGQPTPKAVVRAWMGSPAHRQNVLNCAMRHTGLVAVADTRGTLWWGQVFARR